MPDGGGLPGGLCPEGLLSARLQLKQGREDCFDNLERLHREDIRREGRTAGALLAQVPGVCVSGRDAEGAHVGDGGEQGGVRAGFEAAAGVFARQGIVVFKKVSVSTIQP